MRLHFPTPTPTRFVRSAASTVAAPVLGVLLVIGVVAIPGGVAGAVGTTANAISAIATPSAGSKGGSFRVSATATSGDTVHITLDPSSTGCALSAGVVSLTRAGTCVVDFNDPGNATYAAAPQVQRRVKVYAANTISLSAAPSAGSVGGSYTPGATATSGDTVARSLATTSTGCTLDAGRVTFTGAGRCLVDFNDAGSGAFAAAAQVRQSIKVYAANVITPSRPPAAGTINGTYAVKASATSGDPVVITLDGASTGCALKGGVVTFTKDGVCLVDFNDAGNGAFAKAVQVQQSITVGTGNPRAQAALSISSVLGRHGHPLTLTSVGGSGSGAVTFSVVNPGTAGCSVAGDLLRTDRAGYCRITATKAADATFASATSAVTTVRILAEGIRAFRLTSAVWSGRTVTTTILGVGFYGSPRITSNVGHTRVVVLRDRGTSLRIRVSVGARVARGVHAFTLVFAHGQRAGVRYVQR